MQQRSLEKENPYKCKKKKRGKLKVLLFGISEYKNIHTCIMFIITVKMVPLVHEEKPTFPQYLCQGSVQSEQHKMLAKLKQKEDKRQKKEARKMNTVEEQQSGFNVNHARARM